MISSRNYYINYRIYIPLNFNSFSKQVCAVNSAFLHMTLKSLNLVRSAFAHDSENPQSGKYALARLLIRSNHETGKEALADLIAGIEDHNAGHRMDRRGLCRQIGAQQWAELLWEIVDDRLWISLSRLDRVRCHGIDPVGES